MQWFPATSMRWATSRILRSRCGPSLWLLALFKSSSRERRARWACIMPHVWHQPGETLLGSEQAVETTDLSLLRMVLPPKAE